MAVVLFCRASESDSGGHADYVAYFSSLGPTYDNRIKPDVVAPGAGLSSALSSKQNSNEKTCDVTLKQGTSMATPAAAGAAALMRQYFEDREGRFWTQSCKPSDDLFCKAFTPSGMLLKALMIHSGNPMSLYHYGSSSRDVDLTGSGTEGKPDAYQGFGRVQLSNVLPLSGKTSFQLTVRDMVDVVENSFMKYSFKVTDSSQPLIVTLSWYDPPAVSGAAKALMNDLDLILKLPSKEKVFGNMDSSRDSVNNNERVFIRKPAKGKYNVMVKAGALPVAGTQRFALVITYAGQAMTSARDEVGMLLEKFQGEFEQDEKEVEAMVEGEVEGEVEVGGRGGVVQTTQSLVRDVALGMKTLVGRAVQHVVGFFAGGAQ